MQEIKYCEDCGKEISNYWTADYYSHIRKKYCDSCRLKRRRESNAKSEANRRLKKRVAKQEKKQAENDELAKKKKMQNATSRGIGLQNQQNKLLREENDKLRETTARQDEIIENLMELNARLTERINGK